MTTPSRFRFRAWHKITKTMYSPAVPVPSGCYISGYSDSGDLTPVTVRRGSAYVLMQSTGIVDRRGKEIFEGDIINYGPETPATVIIWNERFAMWQNLAVFVPGRAYGRVAGNIYETPSLVPKYGAHERITIR